MLDDEKSFEASLQNNCVWIQLSSTCLNCKGQETGSITYKENIETIWMERTNGIIRWRYFPVGYLLALNQNEDEAN